MSFDTGYLADPQQTGSGELIGNTHIVLPEVNFQHLLKIGRFAYYNGGVLSNMDGEPEPNIAGVILRHVGSDIEHGNEVNRDFFREWHYCRFGLATVEMMEGDEPSRFQQVFAQNENGDNDGKATTEDNGDTVEVPGCAFVRAINTNTALVFLNLPPYEGIS